MTKPCRLRRGAARFAVVMVVAARFAVVMVVAAISVLALGLVPAASVQAQPSELRPGGTSLVAAVVDGDTLTLEDGRTVRLVGIQTPKLPLGRKGFVAQPLADEAKAALVSLSLGKMVQLYYGGRETDRYGRRLAHLYLEDGTWVQGAMIERGLARVYSFADNRMMILEMLELERAARDADRGIWRDAYYHVRKVSESEAYEDQFEIVTGRVLETALVRGRAYLNFGDNYKTDFTITIAPKDMRAFRKDGIDLGVYEGRRVRVRGWIEMWNGPMIEVTHPEQIELLDE